MPRQFLILWKKSEWLESKQAKLLDGGLNISEAMRINVKGITDINFLILQNETGFRDVKMNLEWLLPNGNSVETRKNRRPKLT